MTSSPSLQASSVPGRERWAGTILILCSTTCYGISNTVLRLLTDYGIDNDWILFYKEAIGLTVLVPWLLLRLFQGRYRFISKRLILFVTVGAVFCELIGARLHVLGFAVIGLVVTVPLVQSSTLLGTAILGRYILGDPLSRRRKIAIAILIVAVCLLAVGKEMLAVKPIDPETTVETALALAETSEHHLGLFFLVAAGTIVAGIAYSIYIIILRYSIRKFWDDSSSVWRSFQFTQWAGYEFSEQTPASERRSYAPFPITLTMGVVLAVGVAVFGACLALKRGSAGFYEVPELAWRWVAVSGLANVVGFFFQVQGLRMTTAVQASLIAVSQILVLSLIGLVFFAEPINLTVACGLALTAFGVVLSAKPEKPPLQQHE